MSEFIQLEGFLKFGLVTADTEYGAAVSSINLMLRRIIVPIKPTYADAEGSEAAGAFARSLSIEFMANPASASSFSSLLEAAFETDSGELKWTGTQFDEVVSATNKKYSGTIVVTGLDLFGTPGGVRSQTQQFPIKKGTYAVTATP